MAGHSKWKNIKRLKEANDKARGSIFTKLSRAITMAVIESGGITNPEHNVKLRLAVDKAREANMPKENIERAIERGVGPDKAQLTDLRYEAFGPSGVALYITSSSDNPNRTSAEVKNVLDRNGGKLGTPGSVQYLFQHCVAVYFDSSKNTEAQILTFAENTNAIDIQQIDGFDTVYVPFENLGKIHSYVAGLQIEGSPEVIYKAISSVKLMNPEENAKISRLVESLENLDDIQSVYTNVEESIDTV